MTINTTFKVILYWYPPTKLMYVYKFSFELVPLKKVQHLYKQILRGGTSWKLSKLISLWHFSQMKNNQYIKVYLQLNKSLHKAYISVNICWSLWQKSAFVVCNLQTFSLQLAQLFPSPLCHVKPRIFDSPWDSSWDCSSIFSDKSFVMRNKRNTEK